MLFVWWVCSSVAPFSLLAVFSVDVYRTTSAFNSDVSNWNTGAVTTMSHSKCTRSLSLPLWPRRLPLWCVVEYIRQLEVRRVTFLTRFVLFLMVCGLKRNLLLFCLYGGFGLSFLCCTLLSSCSVFRRICVQFRRVEMEYGGGERYATM